MMKPGDKSRMVIDLVIVLLAVGIVAVVFVSAARSAPPPWAACHKPAHVRLLGPPLPVPFQPKRLICDDPPGKRSHQEPPARTAQAIPAQTAHRRSRGRYLARACFPLDSRHVICPEPYRP